MRHESGTNQEVAADVVIDTAMAPAFQKGRAPDWAVRHVLGARVRSPARIELLKTNGSVELSATETFATIQLTAGTAMPAGNPPSSEQVASVILVWPTDADAAAASGSTSGYCPTADFVPSAARVTFGNSGPVTVTNLGGVAAAGRTDRPGEPEGPSGPFRSATPWLVEGLLAVAVGEGRAGLAVLEVGDHYSPCHD